MKGKSARVIALGLVLSVPMFLTGCATAPPTQLSILDAMADSSTRQPQSCAARNGATVCVQTMRLNRVKDCSCVDRRQFMDGRFDGGF
jgi:hypothetical protein